MEYPENKILFSTEDASFNIIEEGFEGKIETRFVQRVPEYFIIYLSSHEGCNKHCRFCHLTATGQTSMWPVGLSEYLDQASQVFNVLKDKIKNESMWKAQAPETVHFNFMARGEPLSNPTMLKESQEIFSGLIRLTEATHDFVFDNYKFLVSSIIPDNFKGDLSEILRDWRSSLYYSLYSVNPKFRKKWLPRAMDPYKALDLIAEYQQKTDREITLHWALIEGQNDTPEDIYETMSAVTERGIKAKFNLVRYNPYSEKYGKEPSEEKIQECFDHINSYLENPKSKIVSRVGFDVKASCGMFVNE